MAMALALCLLLSGFPFLSVYAKVTDNPADQLVAALKANRTAAHKSSPSLSDNAGLACIALQYIKAYKGDCSADAKKPAESDISKTFAPNCGVDASTLSPVTGRFLGCRSNYVRPLEAFSMLMNNKKSLDVFYDKNHTQVGAAVSGTDGGGPYFWCVLLSNGERNGSFVVQGGVAKITKPGCFSGADDECSGAADGSSRFGHVWPWVYVVVTAFVYVGCGFWL